ncbi:MAG TPA: alpha/beta fold hydrolase, partial [Candidatus Competibacteraceae bacterium]|nr:alpha/beta fold hydrolase [Candidatus Competibacteraceae bacterium]
MADREANPARILRIRPTAAAAREPVDDPHYLPADPADLLHADPSRRSPVRFESAGLSLAGHWYRPPGLAMDARTPGIVMCGPFGSVKEQTLPHYAERFAAVGYSVLTFDPRCFGESEGEPRYHFSPDQMIEDFTNGVRFLLGRDDIDAARVAIVGVCLGGGYALSTAARFKPIKAVVSIAGGYNIGGSFQQYMGVDGFAAYYNRVNELVTRQYQTGEVQYIPTTARSLSADVPVAG